MSDKPNPASKIIRERALAILRNTRAQIDPALLSAMKEHLSGVTPSPKKETVFQREEPKASTPVLKDGAEPVDRQKIAQIVLQYMKNREENQKH